MIDITLLEQLKATIREILPETIALRQAIHREPELGSQEFKTREKVAAFLAQTCLEKWSPLDKTDFIGELKGKDPSRTLCLRADMDALPLQERPNLMTYRSVQEGVMHACGHDGHTAILAGTVRVLATLASHLPINVRFVFQPCEEGLVGGKRLIKRGACKNVETAYALHGWPGLPVGAISCKSGPIFGVGAHIRIALFGKGCHGSEPEKGLNPIPCAARITQRLYELHEKLFREAGNILSVCTLKSGQCDNIIPDSAFISGTARFLETTHSTMIERAILDIISEETNGSGLVVHTHFDTQGIIPVNNDPDSNERIRTLAEGYLKTAPYIEAAKASLGMEDFAFYLAGRQGALFLLGQGETCASLHNPSFDFNDQSIENGILMFSLLALTHR